MNQHVNRSGATACPYSGNLESFSLFDPDYIDDPYPYLEQFREQSPVFYNPETDFWIVSRYEDVKRCFMDRKAFSAVNTINPLRAPCPAAGKAIMDAGVVITGTLINEDNPEHGLHRGPVQQSLHPSKLRGMDEFVRARASAELDKIVARGKADLNQDYGFWIPANVIFELMNVPAADIPKIKNWVTGEAEFIWGFPDDETQVDLAVKLGEYWKYCKSFVAKLKAEPEDTFVGAIVKNHVQDPENWSEDYATWLILNFMFAGHETAAAAFANGLRLFMENRDQWELIVNDPALIPGAVEEMLRHRGSVLAWRRVAIEEIELSGVTIPAGANVKLMVGAANHDPAVFEDPNRFDIRRGNASRHLTFGMGPHMCIGAPLARVELQILFEELARRLPHVHLAAAQNWSYPRTTTHRGPEHVYCEWDASANPLPEDRPKAVA